MSLDRTFAFGPFRLFPAQRTLLEDDKPVRLGSRALDLLVELVTHASQIISKEDLIARVWPGVFVDEGSLRVHISALRRALGDDRAQHRYILNVPSRGYSFIAGVVSSVAEGAVEAPFDEYRYDLPVALTRMIGRSDIVASLIADLPRRRCITVVGPGGIGKTRVALAVAEAVAPSYPDGARFVDFSSVGDAQLVPSVVASALGLSAIPSDPTANIIAFLRDKHLLLVLDSCEHVLGEAAALAERVLQHAPGIHILATSREPLKVQGERVRRLPTLAAPPVSSEISANTALTFPAVELFIERASATLDAFSLDDADAPVVSQICRRLDGIPLAIELVAGWTEGFGIRGLARMLEDGFELYAEGGGATVARHRTMNDTLEWSYRWLSEAERAVLCRLGIFAGSFGIDAVRAVVADVEMRAPAVAERLASLVGKSLVNADVVGVDIAYRLLDTTRAFALEKLAKSGKLNTTGRRHALHHRRMMEQAAEDWRSVSTPEWLGKYGRNIDDVRGALKWAYSQDGDPSIGVALTIAALPLWYQSGLMAEYRAYVSRALAVQVAEPRQEMRLLEALGLTALFDRLPENDDNWTRALFLAEQLGSREDQLRSLCGLHAHHSYKGDFSRALAVAKRSYAVAAGSGDDAAGRAEALLGIGLRYLGDYGRAGRHLNAAVLRLMSVGHSAAYGHRYAAQGELSSVLWLQGLPDQALRNLEVATVDVRATRSRALLSATLATVTCPLALFLGDLAMAETSVQSLLELTARNSLIPWSFQAHCLQGTLLVARGDASGLTLLGNGLSLLREAGFGYYTLISLYFLAESLRSFGEIAEAHARIDEALQQSDRSGEYWIMPELLRIKGELLWLEPSAKRAAEDHFLRSRELARKQGALSWELRTAMGLAELWRHNGNTARAIDLLSATYDRFTEGFGTADLIEARNLLDRLRTNKS